MSPEEKRIAALYGDLSAVFFALFNALRLKGDLKGPGSLIAFMF